MQSSGEGTLAPVEKRTLQYGLDAIRCKVEGNIFYFTGRGGGVAKNDFFGENYNEKEDTKGTEELIRGLSVITHILSLV